MATLRDQMELIVLQTMGDLDLATRLGKAVEVLLEDGILSESNNLLEAFDEIVLQYVAAGGGPHE